MHLRCPSTRPLARHLRPHHGNTHAPSVPFVGKHDALGQYPPPKGGARYDESATFSADEWYNELKGVVQWAQGLGAKVLPA